MGYLSLVAPCFVCQRPFSSNPYRVPSYQNEPICRGCIEGINTRRLARGLPPWPIPADAYEPVED